jgi:predicted flap endonuclease-1-like 5' DNA nuclease
MGYLLTQMFLYMLGAFLLGLLLGWIIWGRRHLLVQADLDAARLELDAARRERDGHLAEIDTLRGQLDTCAAARLALERQIAQMRAAQAAPPPAPAPAPRLMETPAASPPPTPAPTPPPAPPRRVIDDLKKISGIGRVNEAKLNGLGITSFAQIAAWTPQDEERFGELLAFEGRIEREEWVRQAKILARGGATEFSQRVERGEVDTSK